MILKQHSKYEKLYRLGLDTQREVLFFLHFSDYTYSIGKPHRKKPAKKLATADCELCFSLQCPPHHLKQATSYGSEGSWLW